MDNNDGFSCVARKIYQRSNGSPLDLIFVEIRNATIDFRKESNAFTSFKLPGIQRLGLVRLSICHVCVVHRAFCSLENGIAIRLGMASCR